MMINEKDDGDDVVRRKAKKLFEKANKKGLIYFINLALNIMDKEQVQEFKKKVKKIKEREKKKRK